MSYHRVIPRDLFNESKLLKCLGQLALHRHDYYSIQQLIRLEYDPRQGFKIAQNPDDGNLYCANMICRRKRDLKEIKLSTIYNDKSPYPLVYEVDNEYFGHIFKDDGTFTDEFMDLIGA